VGAAGASAAPEAARALATLLAEELGAASVAVTSDAVTAHLGALAGRPGAVLAAGTGAVAVGVGADGTVTLVDGWGQWLGDEGGGAWVGREALRAVVRARDGRAGSTALTAAARRRFGDLAALPATLAADGNPAAATAAFAPDVVAAADAGDDVALAVLRRAAAALAETTCAAVRACGVPTAAVVGGLAAWGPVLWQPWRAAVEAAGVTVVPAGGTALDGAALLAARTDLPHETHVLRRTTEEATR
jgi:N-acetylglucosamine kinase-like BadF-type ATPase